ncbi:ABC transporter ATP-binding protein [Spongiactinospora gelatinilytica]|uniref:ABC transporter ATP-binding protein n=1 Tax=Spongiactinospora gelatinilytica TaxID=2666298 RepID=A0A2W2HYF4_9ACTN|nr:ABC transporter ATP-binding protein [Spongiactinospora gelatinilytica]PZG55680.1 ABC transporter ATP-binding protein [Spongiactinospora gelatinilytica]
MTAPGARLQVSDVTVRFAGVTALSGVTFTAEPGTIHAVIGPNGAGKSSLFNVLSGIYKPAEGSVRVDGSELIGLAPHRVTALGVGRAFQNASMFAGLTVEENLLLGRHRLGRGGVFAAGLRLPYARRSEREARAKVREVAEFLGVDHLLALPAAELPYGEAKRVDIARALATEPRLLLLDEPAAGMHTHEKVEVRDTIRRIAAERQITVLLVEHDMGLVMGISEQVTVLDFGQVVTTGPPGRVTSDEAVIAAYLGRAGAAQKARSESQPPS